jgi:hypothetical protein
MVQHRGSNTVQHYDPDAGALLVPCCWEAIWVPHDVGDRQKLTANMEAFESEMNRNAQNRLLGCPKDILRFPVSKFLGSVFSFRPRVLAQVTSLWTDFWIISFLASIAWQDRNECHCCGALATFEKCIETSNPIWHNLTSSNFSPPSNQIHYLPRSWCHFMEVCKAETYSRARGSGSASQHWSGTERLIADKKW